MPRPRKTVDNTDLMPWSEIARRLRMPVKDVRETYDAAMVKLRAACEDSGLDVETLRSYFHSRDAMTPDDERVRQFLNLYYPEYTLEDPAP